MTDRPVQPDESQKSTTTHLTVLPSSGKVDQLRRDIMSDRDSQGASPSQEPVSEAHLVTGSPQVAAAGVPVPEAHSDTIARKLLEGRVIEVIKSIYDPEIPVNIY